MHARRNVKSAVVGKGNIEATFVIRHKDGKPVIDENGRIVRKTAIGLYNVIDAAERYHKEGV